jgi:hypothetical protein
LEADYEVAREKQKYIVVVKTSTGTAEASDPLWRRRLLEAAQVFGRRWVLFVDPEQAEIQAVTFRFPKEKGLEVIFRWLIGLFIILLVFAIIWLLVNAHLI